MDWYIIGKFLHVLLAIAWLGGAFGMILLGTLAARAGDTERLGWVVKLVETLAQRVFIPSTVLILLIGIYITWLKWSFLDAWIVFGIIGVVMTGGIGGAILTPLTEKINKLEAGSEREELMGKFLNTAKADLIMLSVIVWAMVSKPEWSNVVELVAMVVVIVAGVLVFIRR